MITDKLKSYAAAKKEIMPGVEEALGVPGRLEALHLPLPSSGRLVGVFRPVVEPLVLAVLHPRHDLLLVRAV